MTLATNLIDPLGTPEFYDSFYRECQSSLGNDQCNIFYFGPRSNPVCLFTTASEPHMRKITRECAREYVSRGYRFDPTIISAAPVIKQDCVFVRHLQARDIFDRKYRRTFYSLAEVSQKVSLVFRSSRGTYYINLYRNLEQQGFSQDEVAAISQVGDFLCRLVAKHHDLLAPEYMLDGSARTYTADRYAKLLRLIRQSLLTDAAGLTEKEAEVCAAIACGMTAESIALENNISANTVATHRKRAYAKLGISSQNELFARFYNQVGRYAFAELPTPLLAEQCTIKAEH